LLHLAPGDPVIDQLGHHSVRADDDEHRRRLAERRQRLLVLLVVLLVRPVEAT
jgi:hypothetical protein